MATYQTQLAVPFNYVPTFLQFDFQVRLTWASSKPSRTRKSAYMTWGDETLIEAWTRFLRELEHRGVEIPERVARVRTLIEEEGVPRIDHGRISCVALPLWRPDDDIAVSEQVLAEWP